MKTRYPTDVSDHRTAARRRRGRIVLAAMVASITASLLIVVFLISISSNPFARAMGESTPSPLDPAASDSRELGVEDGKVGDGNVMSPFDDDLPAIANLDPGLRAAMQDAARDAIADGFDFHITSGWRSAAYQQSLLVAAVFRYGSVEEASRWVSTPERSKHVSGDAVDIGPTDADSWMSQHGADYGLCQTYANEMWHFELSTAPGGECPAQLPDASAG